MKCEKSFIIMKLILHSYLVYSLSMKLPLKLALADFIGLDVNFINRSFMKSFILLNIIKHNNKKSIFYHFANLIVAGCNAGLEHLVLSDRRCLGTRGRFPVRHLPPTTTATARAPPH